MGFATGTRAERGRIAYVFYNRIQETATDHEIKVSAILGLAIAHEIGHLLLPSDSHSPSGIMQAAWGHAAFRKLWREGLGFTAEQAEFIRSAFR
jgi:hypothetical protein